MWITGHPSKQKIEQAETIHKETYLSYSCESVYHVQSVSVSVNKFLFSIWFEPLLHFLQNFILITVFLLLTLIFKAKQQWQTPKFDIFQKASICALVWSANLIQKPVQISVGQYLVKGFTFFCNLV